MLVMRVLMSKTLAFSRGVVRESMVHVEGLILCMIPTTSLTVVTENCERQPSGFDLGKSRIGRVETDSKEWIVSTLVVKCVKKLLHCSSVKLLQGLAMGTEQMIYCGGKKLFRVAGIGINYIWVMLQSGSGKCSGVDFLMFSISHFMDSYIS